VVTLAEIPSALARAVEETPRADLPAFIAELEKAKATAWARLARPEPAQATRKLVDAEQMARILGVPANWVRDKARAGALPSVMLGHYVRFDPDEVLAAVQKATASHNGRLCAPKKPT
jgi:excisionase family DNA binding protein